MQKGKKRETRGKLDGNDAENQERKMNIEEEKFRKVGEGKVEKGRRQDIQEKKEQRISESDINKKKRDEVCRRREELKGKYDMLIDKWLNIE